MTANAKRACLGVSAFYQDSAAALVADGDIIAASQEERFSRVKHDGRLPVAAIADCLTQSGLRARDIDIVATWTTARSRRPLTQRHMDIAASIQVVTEDIVIRMAQTTRTLTGLPHFIYSLF